MTKAVKIKETSRECKSGKAKDITFIVTKDCQLACKYCYLVGKNAKERMSFEVAKSFIDYVISHENEPEFATESVVWSFIGGEPFLEIELIDKIVSAEAHLAFLTIQKRIGEACNMTARFPYSGMHEDVGVNFKTVVTLLDETLTPGLFDVVLQPRAKRTVIPCVRKPAIYFRTSENVAPVFTQSYDFIHS